MGVEPAIRVSQVGKRFTKYDDAPMLLTGMLRALPRTRRSTMWALRGVDLSVDPGECVGVIGRNGSGKSTLLSLMAGITAPTEGRVRVRGRVAPLVSVGVGFHPELTGRENVLVNGTILGLSRASIEARLDEVVAFAELEEFIDTPVKFYSSGMYVRLGFSVAVHAEPDVLLVDEVLAVGDLGFQIRCYERMMSARRHGTTIVVVSHNLNAIRRMCDRAIVLDAGRVVEDGPTPTAIGRYLDVVSRAAGASSDGKTAVVVIEEFAVCDGAGEPAGYLRAGDELMVRVRIRFERPIHDPLLVLTVNPATGEAHLYSEEAPRQLFGRFAPGDRITCDIRLRAALATGSYSVEAAIVDADRLTLHAATRARTVFVDGRDTVSGIVDLDARFEVNDCTVTALLGSTR